MAEQDTPQRARPQVQILEKDGVIEWMRRLYVEDEPLGLENLNFAAPALQELNQRGWEDSASISTEKNGAKTTIYVLHTLTKVT